MAMVTGGFLDLCRAKGVSVHEMPGWQGRGESDGPFSIRAILLHHDAMGLHNDNVPTNMSQNGVDGSQLWIKFDGTLYVMAAGRKWHAGLGSGWGSIPTNHGNDVALGIETDYSGSGPRDPRIDATIHLVTRAAVEFYGLNPARDLALHKEYAPDRKIDLSNFDADAWRARAAQGDPAAVTWWGAWFAA
jgi:N-acetyl-anhydromuramyl-L-alanine amidase AmpD